jgi:hypothetical protein
MKKTVLLFALLFGILIIYDACESSSASEDSQTSEPTKMSEADLIALGDYIVTTGGCDDCHTPKKMTDHGPEPDMDRRFMGHPSEMELPPINKVATAGWVLFNMDLTAAVGPWGISYAANITSDPSGIGAWTEEHFIKAMREGKHKGLDNGRMILPPMPWQVLAHKTDEDLKAMFAFLKSTKPIQNVVPPPTPPQ